MGQDATDDLPGRPFRDVLAEAYDWLVDDDGYLWGLVAGDMGYDKTDTKLTDLLTAAQMAERDRFHKTGEKVWPVTSAVLPFIQLLAKATDAPSPVAKD